MERRKKIPGDRKETIRIRPGDGKETKRIIPGDRHSFLPDGA